MQVEEKSIPVREDVRAACEMLGLDPLQVACEGRFAVFLAGGRSRAGAGDSARASGRRRRVPDRRSHRAASARVLLQSAIGAQRILDMPAGEQLPRIC